MPSPTRTLTRTALMAALMAISAFIRIPLGPIPLTLQSPLVLIAGYCLGPRQGALAMVLYIAVGLLGLPVFSSGGGPAYVLSPTFGYLLGFVAAAIMAGFAAHINRRDSVTAAYLLMLASLSGIYLPGLLWLMVAMRWIAEVPPDVMTLLRTGLFIPLIGDLVTTIPAAVIGIRLRQQIHRTG